LDPTQRFSGRAESYAKHRPGYPPEVLDLLARECGFAADWRVADVGSGTGNLARLFLENGNAVYGVEPNADMRRAGERALARYGERFASVAGTAEETTLPDGSVELVSAGQAFHWFDRGRTREEFGRILVPGGCVVLVWNERRVSGTAFLEEYEQMILDLGTDYAAVSHRNVSPGDLRGFFGGPYGERTLENRQLLDLDGLRGRLASTSYVPGPDEPGWDALVERLEGLFRKHEDDGRVVLPYDCRVYYGRLSESR
jgi:SAM-dependent methyltransferase